MSDKAFYIGTGIALFFAIVAMVASIINLLMLTGVIPYSVN